MLAPTAYHLLACKTIFTFNARLRSKHDYLYVICKDIFKARKRAPSLPLTITLLVPLLAPTLIPTVSNLFDPHYVPPLTKCILF